MQNDEELEKLGELWLQALKKVNHTKYHKQNHKLNPINLNQKINPKVRKGN